MAKKKNGDAESVAVTGNAVLCDAQSRDVANPIAVLTLDTLTFQIRHDDKNYVHVGDDEHGRWIYVAA